MLLHRSHAYLLTTLIALSMSASLVADSTWTGATSEDMLDGTNWSAGVPSGATANFSTNGLSHKSPTLAGSLSLSGLSLSTTDSYTFGINSGGNLTFGGAGVSNPGNVNQLFNINSGQVNFNGGNVSLDTSGSGKVTYALTNGGSINCTGGFVNGSNAIITIDASSSMSFGYFSPTLGSATATVNGGNLTFNNTSTLGAAQVTVNSGGQINFHDTATGGTGSVILNASTLNVGYGGADFGSPTVTANTGSTIAFNALADATTFNVSGSTLSFIGTASGGNAVVSLASGSTLNFSSGSTTLGSLASSSSSDNINLNGHQLTVGSSNTSTSIAGKILNNSGSASLVKTGSGTLTLSNTSNNYAGGTTFANSTTTGAIQISSQSNLGTGSVTFTSTGFVSNEKLIFASTISSWTLPITTTGNGGAMTLQMNSGVTVTMTSPGAITGGDSQLYVHGPGTLAFDSTVTNTYQDWTIVNNGATLSITTSSQLSGNTFKLQNSSTLAVPASAGSFSFTPTSVGISNGVGTFNIGSGSTLTASASFSTGATSDSFQKSGAGTLILTGNNSSITGATTVAAGTLKAGATTALSSSSATTVTGTLDLAGFSNTIASLAGAGTVESSTGSGVLTTGGGTTFSGNLVNGGGTLGLTLSSGTLILSGNNTYSGATTITAGTLKAGATTAFSSNSGATVTGTLDLAGFSNTIVSLAGAGTVESSTGSATLTTGGGTTFSGNLVNGGGTLGLTLSGSTLILSGNNTYSGATTVSGGTLKGGSITAFSSNSPTTVTGILDLAGFSNTIASLAGAGTVESSTGSATLTTGGGTTFSGTLQNGGGTLGLTLSSGTLTLSGSNTYSGVTTLSGGTLAAGAANTFSSNSAVTLSGSGILSLAGHNNTIASLASASGSSAVSLGAGILTTGGNNTSTSFSGAMGSGDTGGLIKTGTGTFTLSGASNYTGATTVSGGTLAAGAVNVFSSGSAFTLSGSATLDLAGHNNIIGSLASASGSSTVSLGAGMLTMGGNNTSTTFAGAFSGAGNFTKTGSGIFTFTGTGSAGSATISAGTVEIDSTLASTAVTVQNGGTLAGTGTSSGTVAVEAGGTLSPGNTSSPYGTLNVGAVTYDTAAITAISLTQTQNSQIVAGGLSTLGGAVQLNQGGSPYLYPQIGQFLIWSGSYDGTFNEGVTGTLLPNFDFTLVYDPGEFVYLTYLFAPNINTSGLSGNALKVANYLNDNADHLALAYLSHLTGQTLADALDAISPSRNDFGAYAQQQVAFSLSGVLSEHTDQVRVRGVSEEGELTADASDTIAPCKYNKFTGWVSGLGEYARQKKQSQDPAFHFTSAAALAGLDYRINRDDFAGLALGYVHTYFKEQGHLGSGKINSYFGSLYGVLFIDDFYLSPAVWGIFNENHNIRHIAFPEFSANAKANIFSWELLPHLEAGYEFRRCWGTFTPFAQADWAINWQRGYQEQGAVPYNATQKSKQNSMLRTEAGLKFCEKTCMRWGTFFLKEKLSYVFQKPFGTGVTTSLTGIPSSFTVTTLTENLNLGDFAIDMILAIGKKNPTTLSLGYEGEFGSHFWSQDLRLTLAKDF